MPAAGQNFYLWFSAPAKHTVKKDVAPVNQTIYFKLLGPANQPKDLLQVVGASGQSHLARQLIEFLMGETDGVPKDAKVNLNYNDLFDK